jgi:hypothetical protein
VKTAAATVRRLRKMGATTKTRISAFKDKNGRWKDITNTTALSHLRNFIKFIDPVYGLQASEIGLHSLRSSSAMAMFLAGVPVCTIMLIGRWRSNAFLRYIQPQVSQFSNNVSRHMILNQMYFHLAQGTGIGENLQQQSVVANARSIMDGGDAATESEAVFSVWK